VSNLQREKIRLHHVSTKGRREWRFYVRRSKRKRETKKNTKKLEEGREKRMAE